MSRFRSVRRTAGVGAELPVLQAPRSGKCCPFAVAGKLSRGLFCNCRGRPRASAASLSYRSLGKLGLPCRNWMGQSRCADQPYEYLVGTVRGRRRPMKNSAQRIPTSHVGGCPYLRASRRQPSALRVARSSARRSRRRSRGLGSRHQRKIANGTDGLRTHRWREVDSNLQSRVSGSTGFCETASTRNSEGFLFTISA